MSNGIPPLLNQIANITNIANLVLADSLLIYQLFEQSKWGIFKKKTLDNVYVTQGINAQKKVVYERVLTPNSIVSLDYEKEWAIANYPMELGQFQSYNKVTIPYQSTVSMTKGGTLLEKAEFLLTLETIAQSLDLYDIVTPEHYYTNANIQGFNYRRNSDSGAGLITAEISFIEVRTTAAPAFTDTGDPVISAKQPSGYNPVSSGTVQPQTAAPVGVPR